MKLFFRKPELATPWERAVKPGGAIAKGEEVVVTHQEKGIAYVRRWEEMAGEQAAEQVAGGKR